MTHFAVTRVNDLDTLPPLKIREHVPRNAPHTMPNPPFLCGIFGSRGAGKTTAMIHLLRLYDAVEAFDEITIFSPTFEKDPKFEAFLESKPFAKLDLDPFYSDAKFKDMLDRWDGRLAEYEKFQKATKAYQKFNKQGVSSLTEEELLLLYQYDFTDPKKFDNFKHGRPSFCVVFDDQVGNKQIYRNDSAGRVGTFTLRHRHYNCSVIFLSQAYENGIPKQLRANLSMAVFFANKSDKMKFSVADEMSSHVSPEQLVEMWKFSTETEDHGMFVIIFNAQKKEWRFRKNFDTLILPTRSDTGGRLEETTEEESDHPSGSKAAVDIPEEQNVPGPFSHPAGGRLPHQGGKRTDTAEEKKKKRRRR